MCWCGTLHACADTIAPSHVPAAVRGAGVVVQVHTPEHKSSLCAFPSGNIRIVGGSPGDFTREPPIPHAETLNCNSERKCSSS